MMTEIHNCPFCGASNIKSKGRNRFICDDCDIEFIVTGKKHTVINPLPGQITMFDFIDNEIENIKDNQRRIQ